MGSYSREITDINEIAFRADESSFKPDTWVAYFNGELVGHSRRRRKDVLKSLDRRGIQKYVMIAQVGDNSIIDIPTVLEVE